MVPSRVSGCFPRIVALLHGKTMIKEDDVTEAIVARLASSNPRSDNPGYVEYLGPRASSPDGEEVQLGSSCLGSLSFGLLRCLCPLNLLKGRRCRKGVGVKRDCENSNQCFIAVSGASTCAPTPRFS